MLKLIHQCRKAIRYRLDRLKTQSTTNILLMMMTTSDYFSPTHFAYG
jgi:hypothetical protein